MSEISERVERALERSGAGAMMMRQGSLRGELARLKRERAELAGQIPLWDRLMVFSDSADEARVKELDAEIKGLEAEAAGLLSELEAASTQVVEDCPAYRFALAADRCAQLGERGLNVGGLIFKNVGNKDELRDALRRLDAELLESYVPDFEMESFFGALLDEESCRRAGEGIASEPIANDLMGFAPMPTERLLPLVSHRLVHGSQYFEQLAKHRALTGERDEVEEGYFAAKGNVPFLDKLNIFSTSAVEAERDELAERFAKLEEESCVAYEHVKATLHGALDVYPPLRLHQALLEALGIALLLEVETELTLSASGKVLGRNVTAPQALVLAAMSRLGEAVQVALPGVPLPSELRNRGASGENPRSPMIAAFLKGLDASDADRVRGLALSHASAQGSIRLAMSEVAEEVSLIDRLVFWSDTASEAREQALEERLHWNDEWTRGLWNKLLAEARHTGSEIPPFCLRDLAMDAVQAVHSIHTDAGESNSPKSCRVYNQGSALAALEALSKALRKFYGISGSRRTLLKLAATAKPRDIEVRDDTVRMYGRHSLEEIAGFVAYELQGGEFSNLVKESEELEQKLGSKSSSLEDVQTEISLWDRINIFTTSDAESREDDLQDEIGYLSAELKKRMVSSMQSLHQVLAQFPPARLYFGLGEVEAAVGAVRAVCCSRRVTTGEGDNKRTETRYYCSLTGLDAAIQAAEAWAGRLVGVFGELPGYHELLALWELEKRKPSAAEADPEG